MFFQLGLIQVYFKIFLYAAQVVNLRADII